MAMNPLNVDERSQVDSHVIESVIGVFGPRLKLLRARRELAFRDIQIGHGLQYKFSENPYHNLEVHQRFR